MKRVFYFLFGLITAIGLTACSGQKSLETSKKEETVKEKPINEEPETEGTTKEDSSTEEPESTPDEPVLTEPKVYQNTAFKDVVVTETVDQVVVTGKAQVFEGVFQYKLHDGEQVFLENHYQTAGAPEWGDFTISFEKNLIDGYHVLFELFVYSAKDGSKINVLEIPIPSSK